MKNDPAPSDNVSAVKTDLGLPGGERVAEHVLQNSTQVEVVDPGHKYRLPSFDGDLFQTLTFMKREGEGFPGNVGHYPGTNLQSVLRACLDRVIYLQRQIPHENNIAIMCHLRHCLRELEQRAAARHGFNVNVITLDLASDGAMCIVCGHVLCGHSVPNWNVSGALTGTSALPDSSSPTTTVPASLEIPASVAEAALAMSIGPSTAHLICDAHNAAITKAKSPPSNNSGNEAPVAPKAVDAPRQNPLSANICVSTDTTTAGALTTARFEFT